MNRAVSTVWIAWLVLMAGANLATPLYAVYAREFGFSSLVLTSIFATYAFVLVPALILFGRLSDRFGRRPVLFAGLSVAAVALVLFAAADGVAWLYAARALQGLAVGMISGAAAAALVELDPAGDRRRAALLAGLAQAGGSAVGPLFAGALAEWAPNPLELCFLVALGLTALTAAASLTVPEPAGREREGWRIEWPRVPAELRRDFFRVSLTAATVWASVALLLSIVPSYAGDLLGTTNLALLALIAAVALLASCVSQIVAQRFEGRRRPEPGRRSCAARAGSRRARSGGTIQVARLPPLGRGSCGRRPRPRFPERAAGAKRPRARGASWRGHLRVHQLHLPPRRDSGDCDGGRRPAPVVVGGGGCRRSGAHRDRHRDGVVAVARAGIEPATPRFSAVCDGGL